MSAEHPSSSIAESAPRVTRADVEEAYARISATVHETPVMTCQAIDERADREIFFKCENFQKVGAFKFRGACHAISRLPEAQAQRGVVTHSSGNHGQALALAAKLHGIAAHIVIPRNAPAVKKSAVAGYGGIVIECEPTLAARETMTRVVQEETGATLIPPYDHPHIIAGQGTASLELTRQVDSLDAIVAPVGGGGLISGTCAVAADSSPPIRVFAAEPEGADDAFRSKQAGHLIPQQNPQTIGDGLLTSLGDWTWPFVRDLVEAVVTVSDDEIRAAMKLIWERAKIVVEPSAAVALAAVLSDKFPAADGLQRVGVILSGGNVDLDHLPW